MRAEDERARTLTDTARFFAGMRVDPASELYSSTQTAIWKCFASRLDALWAAFRGTQGRLKAWSESELGPVYDPSTTLFYPFGGPDIVFAESFFPCAPRLILVGLEPVGAVPASEGLTAQRLDEMLSACMISVQDVIQLSFFRTKVMEGELSSSLVKGVVPIFLVSLARLGLEIREVEVGNLDDNAEFVREDEASPGEKRVARIRYRRPGEDFEKTLTYFSYDLSNGGFKKRPGLEAYLRRNAASCFTLIKSASYLCRKPYFSTIRNLVLDRSYGVLQDDSGLAFASFDRKLWGITLYGRYEGPVELFKEYFEPDLYEAMKQSAKPLGFRFGYARTSSLTLAVKKPAGE